MKGRQINRLTLIISPVIAVVGLSQ